MIGKSSTTLPTTLNTFTLSRRGLLLGTGGVLLLAACGGGEEEASSGPLSISAIPDQDPEVLNRLYGDVASRFSDALGLDVRYTPVTEYPAVVRGFEVGDIYLAWMGGLTGVQATARVPDAKAIAQRDIDADFHSGELRGGRGQRAGVGRDGGGWRGGPVRRRRPVPHPRLR